MHNEAWEFLENKSKELTPVSIIDIGGRNINGSARDLWPDAEYTALDRVKGDGVDIVADATTWKPTRFWEMGLCTEVFEHVSPSDYRKMLTVIASAINPGGTLLITCATHPREPHAADGTPGMPKSEFYRNVDPMDLAIALTETGWMCKDLIIDRDHGDIYVEAVRTGQTGSQ